MKTINHELIRIALEKADGGQFEKFANAAFAELIGPDYVPLGGTRDWGADGLLSSVAESKRTGVFYQFSIVEDFRAKIRNTVARLREVGRDVNTLNYATSRQIPRQDITEGELSDELGVNVRIRDGEYLVSQVNFSPAMIQAFNTYLAPAIEYLSDLKTASLLPSDAGTADAAVYVFLRNELDSRDIGGSTEGLADGLIIWALRDTGSDEGSFFTAAQVSEQIEKDVPGMISVLGSTIPARLKALSETPQGQQRPIRHHKKEGKYCIAFDLKSKMQQENLLAEDLQRAVLATHRVRILAQQPDAGDGFLATASKVALRSIQRMLEKEGIEFAAFLRGEADEPKSIVGCIEDCLLEEAIPQAEFQRFSDTVLSVLRDAFVSPTREERVLYSRTASVYTLLFCLRAEPRLIQYFSRLAGHFRFYVGADVLVLALAERFLPNEDKLFNNTLALIKSAGGELILTEPVVEEVQRHIYATNQEFRNHYDDAEEAITPDNVEFVDRPLIRAYFRGKFSGVKNAPHNWPQFVRNYCDPRGIQSDAAKDDVRKSLMAMMGMIFESRDVVEAACAARNVEDLAKRLEPFKKDKQLARNDSLMTHRVYSRREEDKENDDVSGFGLRTWWLTNEVKITHLTRDLVHAEKASYLMRPDYLLSFLTLLPKKQDARAIFETLFPSLLGVHLARAHSSAHVERLHSYLAEIKAVEPARRRVMVAQQSDLLKSDLRKASWHQRNTESATASDAEPTD